MHGKISQFGFAVVFNYRTTIAPLVVKVVGESSGGASELPPMCQEQEMQRWVSSMMLSQTQ